MAANREKTAEQNHTIFFTQQMVCSLIFKDTKKLCTSITEVQMKFNQMKAHYFKNSQAYFSLFLETVSEIK